jgi:uncharacterized protein YbjT (DUF2867 family)
MNIALFGATGGTGSQVVEQALQQGHQIRALVRQPDKLGSRQSEISVIEGDVLDQASVDACIEGTDAVVCVLGTHGGLGRQEPIEARGTARIIDSMQRLGVRRLIAVTSLGVGDSIDQVPGFFRVLMKLTLKRIMEAKEEQERLIRASELDWTIVRPGGLTDGPKTDSYRFGTDKSIQATRVSRADVADFVLRQLTDERWVHQAPAIS